MGSWKFKPFVANRLGEIQSLTNPEQWRHVPNKQNPADLLTRGLSVSALTEEDRWWKSLVFLVKKETEWPEKKVVVTKTRRSENSTGKMYKSDPFSR